MKTFILLVLCICLIKTNSIPINAETDSDYIYSEPQENALCVKDSNYGGPTMLPHESNCGKYYMCMDGLAYEITCPTERYWSSVTNTCETFEEARCSDNYS